MQLKGCYQRQPGPQAYSNTLMPTLYSHLLTPLAKLPHFNPVVCKELREMIFRRQSALQRKRREERLVSVSEVALTLPLMESN